MADDGEVGEEVRVCLLCLCRLLMELSWWALENENEKSEKLQILGYGRYSDNGAALVGHVPGLGDSS